VDHALKDITSLDPADRRAFTLKVAGPAALLVAKLHKLGDRDEHDPHRLSDKDAHDVYRLLVGVTTQALSSALKGLLANEFAAESTRVALDHFDGLFANGPEALGCHMAGRAEELLGEPAIVAQATAALAGDLVRALRG
jgi:hypothetical protein